MFLKDRVSRPSEQYRNTSAMGKNGKKDGCLRFNKGKCTAGMGCHYEHRCLHCGKFGHGEHICRKKAQG